MLLTALILPQSGGLRQLGFCAETPRQLSFSLSPCILGPVVGQSVRLADEVHPPVKRFCLDTGARCQIDSIFWPGYERARHAQRTISENPDRRR